MIREACLWNVLDYAVFFNKRLCGLTIPASSGIFFRTFLVVKPYVEVSPTPQYNEL